MTSWARLGARGAALVLFLHLFLSGRVARAEAPSPELMAKLAAYAHSFELERIHASYTVNGRMDFVGSDDQVSSRKELVGRVDARGGNPKLTVIRYTEDGKDKTSDGIKQAEERDERIKKKRDSGKELKIPVLPSEQGRYLFEVAEQSADGGRMLIRFAPKVPAEDTVLGSAWVDVAAGTIISAAFQPSQTSMFIDYIHFELEFGATTSFGPAISRVVVEGQGGLLFFRKHFRASATLSDYVMQP